MENFTELSFKENRIVIDWFSFSCRTSTKEEIVELLGMEDISFENIFGCNGYTDRLYYEGVSIHYGSSGSTRFGHPIQGCWLELSGKGCRTFERYGCGDWVKLFDFVSKNKDFCTVNRLDIAYDDFLGFLDMSKLVEDTEKLNFVSKFRSPAEVIKSIDLSTGDVGCTINHGRKGSDTFIRIYDKRFEQHIQDICQHWIRAEIMLRHDRAATAVELLLDKDVDELYFLIMNNYLRYIQPQTSDSNRWRIPQADHWKRFSESVTTYRISLFSRPDEAYTSERLDNYVENMAGGAIYTYIKIHGVDNLVKAVNDKFNFLNPKYRLLLSGEPESLIVENFSNENDDEFFVQDSQSERHHICKYCGLESTEDRFITYIGLNGSGICYDCYHKGCVEL